MEILLSVRTSKVFSPGNNFFLFFLSPDLSILYSQTSNIWSSYPRKHRVVWVGGRPLQTAHFHLFNHIDQNEGATLTLNT